MAKKHDETQNENQKSEEIKDLENQVKRTLADYQNLQKRVLGERKDWIRSANKELILRLLPSLDTLILAQKHIKDQGLDLSVQQFLDALKNEGLQRIEAEGKYFDPNIMEAVEAEEGEEGKVISEIRAGYTINGEVLRPAQVKVGKNRVDQKEEEKAKEELQKGDYT
jgi:molecular chaperone GrpE